MGRFLLIMVAATAVSSAVLMTGETDVAAVETHVRSQNRALVRETAEDALATVLNDAIHPTDARWRTALTLGEEIEVDGQRVTIDEYRLEEGGTVAVIALTAYRGGVSHRTEGRYRFQAPDWPTPLWVSAPYAFADIDSKTKVDWTDPSKGLRPGYFDATRFEEYRLGSVLSLTDLGQDFGRELAGTRGTNGGLQVVSSMDDVLARFGTPTITDLYGRALGAIEAGRDVTFEGNQVVTGKVTYGGYNDGAYSARKSSDPRIVLVRGDLTVGAKGDLRGDGLLIVQGDLVVNGKLRWDGLVLVMDDGANPGSQKLRVDAQDGELRIRGSLLVDQEAPPPGGHTDITVNRDLSGAWAQPYGDVWGNTPAYRKYRGTYPFYQHTHRIDREIPEVRTFYFAERGRDRHETYTAFRATLNDVAARYPGEEVYIRFKNARNHGAAVFRLRTGSTTYAGSVGAGFGTHARSGDSWASPSFRPGAVDDFVVDVRSLRLLTHLIDGKKPSSPAWSSTGSCSSRPICVGQLADRDGALTVQIVRERNDAVLYEASVYWHTHADGQPEALQEAAADQAWRTAIRSGLADYGTEIRFGKHAELEYEIDRTTAILRRLGVARLGIIHEGTFTEHTDVVGVHDRGDPGVSYDEDQIVTVCHRGKTDRFKYEKFLDHADHTTLGACSGSDDSGSGGSGD